MELRVWRLGGRRLDTLGLVWFGPVWVWFILMMMMVVVDTHMESAGHMFRYLLSLLFDRMERFLTKLGCVRVIVLLL